MNNKLVKLIALDLDGTLLDNNGEIHPKNLKIIKKIHEERPDIKIVIATGTAPLLVLNNMLNNVKVNM